MILNMEIIFIKSIILLIKYSAILNIIANLTFKKQKQIYFKLKKTVQEGTHCNLSPMIS